MTARIQTNRFTTTGSRPPSTRPVGELAINFADNQISVTDPTPAARDMLPIRNHAATAQYAAAALVANAGRLYRAKSTITPKAFAYADWIGISDQLNVLDFGAKLDGTTNDTAAFNAARAAAKDGQTIYVPSGSMVLNALAVDTSKQVRWLLDGATTGGGDNITFAPVGCGDIIESMLQSGVKYFGKRTNPSSATSLMRLDYILDAVGGSSGFIESGLVVNGTINNGVQNAMWVANFVGDNNSSDPNSGGLAVLQVTGRKNSSAIVQTIQATSLDTTGLASSVNSSRGFSTLEIAQRANNVDDAANGAMWGGIGVRVCQHLNSTVQNTALNIETSFAAGLFISTDATPQTYVKSGISAAMNYQTYQFIDTRGCIPPYVSTNPVAAVRMKTGQVVDFNGGPALNSASGNYLQYQTIGGNRLRYVSGTTEVFNVTDTGSITTLASYGLPTGAGLSSDATYTVLAMDSSLYRLRYTRATGLLEYRRSDDALLWSVDAAGTSTVPGTLNVGSNIGVGGTGVVYSGVLSGNHTHAFGWTGSAITAFVDGSSQGAIAMAANLNSYLSLAGGTITGNLGVAGAGGLNVSPGGITTSGGLNVSGGNLAVSAGSITAVGSISASGNVGSAAAVAAGTDLFARGGHVYFGAADNCALIADGGGTTLKFSADNWRLFWAASSGIMTFYSNLNTALFTVDGGGNGTFHGTVHGSNVTLMEARIDELQARIAALEGPAP